MKKIEKKKSCFNRLISHNEGQAVFELLVFLPFLIFIFTVMITIGNSINASINQQKVTRRYYFYLSKGNSSYPSRDDLDAWLQSGLTIAGMSSLGYRHRDDNDQSIATCFKFNTLFSENNDEECEDELSDNKSNFIRIYTFYGICGETYINQGNYYKSYHNFSLASQASSQASCTIR